MKKLNCGRSLDYMETESFSHDGDIQYIKIAQVQGDYKDVVYITPKQLETLYKSAKKEGLVK